MDDDRAIAAELTQAGLEGTTISSATLLTAARLVRELADLREEDRMLRKAAEFASAKGWDFGLRWHADRRTWRATFHLRVNRWWNREAGFEAGELRQAIRQGVRAARACG